MLLWVKAVAGASKQEVAGAVGDRLKVKVNAAAEGGKANQAICKLVAEALGVKARQVTIESGPTNPEKIVRVQGVEVGAVREAISHKA